MSNLPAGVTSREIEASQLANSEMVVCHHCLREFGYEEKGVIEVRRVHKTVYLCSAACRSGIVFEETYSVSGRADLMRVIAALHLLMESKVLSRAPAVTIYGADYAQPCNEDGMLSTFEFAEFRKQALAFLDVLSPEGCAWANEVQDLAGEFGEQLSAKATASFTKLSTAIGTPKEAKVLDVTA